MLPAQGDKGSAILVIHFIVGDAAALMAKLGTRWSTLSLQSEGTIRIAKHLKTRLGSSFTVRISA